MKKLLLGIATLWAAGAFGIWYWADARTARFTYRTIPVRRGELRTTINATGTIEPEDVVDVGAQVAGMIESFGSDPDDASKPVSYGARVEQGTVLARLDSALFKARVEQAKGRVARDEADITQAKAKLAQAERDHIRARKLLDRGNGMIAPQEYDAALSTFEAAKAALVVAEGALLVSKADLQEATVNLGYTTIKSPVKGVVLDRRINIGQTVVASLNAPSLFLIAKDLSRMQIWSSVNETDIGSIRRGQAVHFTVGAFPHDRFEGTVTQIRLNASMSQNVVTYTVVVSFDNAGGKLMPYLTARLQFEVESRKDVPIVPNAALRWQPRPENVVPEERANLATYLRPGRPSKSASKDAEPRTKPADAADWKQVLWAREGDYVRPIPVELGLTDGTSTEIKGGNVKDGTEIVTGATRAESATDALSILPHTWTDKK